MHVKTGKSQSYARPGQVDRRQTNTSLSPTAQQPRYQTNPKLTQKQIYWKAWSFHHTTYFCCLHATHSTQL